MESVELYVIDSDLEVERLPEGDALYATACYLSFTSQSCMQTNASLMTAASSVTS